MAATAVKILRVTTFPDQTVEVACTHGTPPLGSQETFSMIFDNVDHLKRQVLSTPITEDVLMKLHLAITYIKPDGSLGNLNQVLNKTLVYDPEAAQPFRVV